MVGRHGLSGMKDLWHNLIDLVTIQGSHRCADGLMPCVHACAGMLIRTNTHDLVNFSSWLQQQ